MSPVRIRSVAPNSPHRGRSITLPTVTTSPDLDLAVVDRLLTTTRAVRRRLDLQRPVEDDVLLDCLRLATQAPTGGNIQHWRWMIVRDETKRHKLAELYNQAFGPYIAIQEQAVDPNNEQQMRVIRSAKHLGEVMHEIPVLVIPCELGRPDEMAMAPGWSNATASGFYGSVWPAVWSFMLALRSRGLGSALTTLHLVFEKEVGELLGIPETVTQIGLVPVAYFTGKTFKPANRRPAEEITYWDAWKNTKG
jgi:nitroreductase